MRFAFKVDRNLWKFAGRGAERITRISMNCKDFGTQTEFRRIVPDERAGSTKGVADLRRAICE